MPLYAHIVLADLPPAVRRALSHPWAPPCGSCLSLVLHQYPSGAILVRAVGPHHPDRTVPVPPGQWTPVPVPDPPSAYSPQPSSPPLPHHRPWS